MGALIWPASMTRPDIMFYVAFLCTMMQRPTLAAYNAGLRVLGYLVMTKNIGINFGGKLKIPLGFDAFPFGFHTSNGLISYSDTSWGKTPKPMAGYVVFYCNGPIDWSARVLKVIADSTCEAETAIASRATKAVIFIRSLLEHMRLQVFGATVIAVDNSALIKVVTKEGLTSRTRYFERSTLLIKEAWMKGIVEPVLVSTVDEVADIFTKALDADTFNRLKNYLLNLPPLRNIREMGLTVIQKMKSIFEMYK